MASPPVTDDLSQAGRRAKVRIGIALALLITAIGILAFLNQSKTSTEPAADTAQSSAQVSMSSQETEKAAEPEAPKIPDATPPPPVTTAQTPVEQAPVTPPPPPQVTEKLALSPAVKTLLAAPHPAEKPKPPVVVAKPAPSEPVTKAAPQPMPKPAPEPEPAAKATPSTKSEAIPNKPAVGPVASTEKITPAKAYEVQLGVFSDMENAKQLQTKLAEHGIPSHTETRVQIGPFKTRAEADQAKIKLKELGVNGVIAPK